MTPEQLDILIAILRSIDSRLNDINDSLKCARDSKDGKISIVDISEI